MAVSRIASTTASVTVPEPLLLEDLQVGDRWESGWREITSADVADFARLTGDHDPLHEQGESQPAEGGRSPFGEPVAHGLLGLGVMAGLSADHPRASTLALVGVTDWSFEHPIYFEDRVQVVTEIETIEPHGRRAGRVTWFRQLLNQDGRLVQQGRIITLVARRSPSRRAASACQTATARPASNGHRQDRRRPR